MIPIVTKTERTILVNLIDLLEDDYPTNYRSWFTDREVTAQNSHGLFPYTEEAMRKYLKEIKNEGSIVWAILVPPRCIDDYIKGNKLLCHNDYKEGMRHEDFFSSPTHIGNISLQRINWIYRSAEMAIVIGEKDYWNTGYATEVLSALYDHGFNKMNLHRIWSGTAASNIGMQKAFQKLGMRHEGTFIHAMFLNGYWTDVVEYGILDHQWRELRRKEGMEHNAS